MLPFLFLFAYMRFVLFVRVKSFVKKRKKGQNCPNDLIYITTYMQNQLSFSVFGNLDNHLLTNKICWFAVTRPGLQKMYISKKIFDAHS